MGDIDFLNKLEVYTFANCSDVMRHAPGLTTKKGNPMPWIENFANEYDVVARLGVLAPRKKKWGIYIDGDVYRKGGGWGHCLNLHYLMGLKEHLDDPGDVKNPYAHWEGDKGNGKTPRLYGYYDGAVPEPY